MSFEQVRPAPNWVTEQGSHTKAAASLQQHDDKEKTQGPASVQTSAGLKCCGGTFCELLINKRLNEPKQYWTKSKFLQNKVHSL